ncbi:UNVERIFIED_CONTAM: hypothetical protein GTU68_039669 [Idotea baltica]|nr:hypothetical protein [Idotea baltica]
MKAGDKPRLATLRLMSAAIKQIEVDQRIELDEPGTISVLDKMLKQRRESIAQYEKANREDLIAVEQSEITLIQEYMPAALSTDEIASVIDEAISSSGASSIKDMGKVMGVVKPLLQGKADMSAVSQIIKQRLNA